jgi:hypothetical protein
MNIIDVLEIFEDGISWGNSVSGPKSKSEEENTQRTAKEVNSRTYN